MKTQHPRTSFTAQLAITDVKEWSKESRKKAVNEAYKKFSSVTPTSSNPVLLPSGYKNDAKAKAAGYATLAGYRLADTIKELAEDTP